MRHRKIANAKHEEGGLLTSADFCGRPVPRGLRKIKRVLNRAAKRKDRRQALSDV